MAELSDPQSLKNVLDVMAEALLPGAFAVAAGAVADFAAFSLAPAECSRPMHPSRLATLRAGRACAHLALRSLGAPDGPLPRQPSGAPLWPAGFTGSISHTSQAAAAIVGLAPPLQSLGLDLESSAPIERTALVARICRPEELMERSPAHSANRERAKLLFVVKEAVYKAYAPLTQAFLGFHDVRVTFDDTMERFVADVIGGAAGGPSVIRGRVARSGGLFIALAFHADM